LLAALLYQTAPVPRNKQRLAATIISNIVDLSGVSTA
jgi:hypothetical protein